VIINGIKNLKLLFNILLGDCRHEPQTRKIENPIKNPRKADLEKVKRNPDPVTNRIMNRVHLGINPNNVSCGTFSDLTLALSL
jgi:hypothetical protein